MGIIDPIIAERLARGNIYSRDICTVEPHAFAETLLRGDLNFHEFIHKRALRIMSSRAKRTVLFIELRRVMLYALYLAQAFTEGAVIAIRSHVAFLSWLTEL